MDINKATVAEINSKGKHFEILVDCEKAMEFRKGKEILLEDLAPSEHIFTDVKKGEHAKEHDLKAIFNLGNTEIIKKIIKEGTIHLTADYKNKLKEDAKRKIITLIHRNAINPSINAPIPITRIETALAEAKVKIDENKPAEQQIKYIISKISEIMPIKYELRKIQVIIPSEFSRSSYHILKQYGKLIKDEWRSNGDLIAVVELPAGMQQEFFDELNKMSHGKIETKTIQGVDQK
ncbi:MAG: ribosome assembly factor SBDS [Nanoarchaeota archaeon]|nr:ribosome assembly factor SBDS [Nanoarchaeota archaeon]